MSASITALSFAIAIVLEEILLIIIMSDILTRKNVQDYLSTFTELVVDMLEDPKLSDLGITKQWISNVLFRNVPNAEVLHGLATTLAYKHLVKVPTNKGLQDAYVIGWCLQMFASCYFILDDIFDQSQTRHYKPCWYLVDNKGNQALNDVTLIESTVFYLLKQHFGDRDFYLDLLQTFQDLSFKMALSQSLETQLSRDNEHSIDEVFTMKTYSTLVKYKMCYYPTYIHVVVAMCLAGIKDQDLLKTTRRIFEKIDFHFQPRDDFLDVYGDNKDHEAETGNDIEEKRCSWNICTALELANPEQKEILITHYGKKSASSMEAVKAVYDEIGLPAVFEAYETERYENILQDIESLPEELPKELFKDMMWASFPTQMKKGKSSGSSMENLKSLTKDIPNFLGVFPELVQDLISDPETGADLGDLGPSISRLLHYNVPHGKKTRGLTIAFAYKALGNDLNDDVVTKSYILGWCLEMLQAAALVADDVMDDSTKRRGRACWYKVEGVGMVAYNDAIILESALYRILKKHFGNEDYYLELLELFQDNTFKTAYGQALDVQTGKEMDLETFTMERYTNIVKYKTSYYTFYLPVALSLAMSGIKSKSFLEQSTTFLLDIGHFFQVQDDYLDCFGDYETIGKVGTDIADGKCSWLVVSALEMASPEQRQFIKENYGHGLEDSAKLKKIKDLYIEMKLPEIYAKYEQETYDALRAKVDTMSFIAEEHRNIFLEILRTTYKRKA